MQVDLGERVVEVVAVHCGASQERERYGEVHGTQVPMHATVPTLCHAKNVIPTLL
jgi:hypothetical protein